MTDRKDYAWLNQVALTTLSRGYLREGIPQDKLFDAAVERINEIVDRAEHILGVQLRTLRLGIRRGWVSPASPVWSNFGVGRGLPISCNGSYMDDNMDSILWKTAEVGMMTKEGAGTSVYMGALRPFGSQIAGGGKSEGPKHFARLIQEDVQVISQSNVRRGNAAIYLDIEHADIERWLKIRSIAGGVHDEIQHLSFGVCIGDEWMNEMLAEQKGGPKRTLIAKIRNKRRETGFPFIFFRDAANRGRPDILKELGMEIHATNLCITGDQRVVTSNGLLTAKELHDAGRELVLFDGNKAVAASEMKLRGYDEDVYRVTLANGMEHKITAYHSLPVRNANAVGYVMTPCDELVVGDRIEIQTSKGLFGSESAVDEAFMLGLFQGDGTSAGREVMIDIWENDFDLEPEILATMSRLYKKYPVIHEKGRIYSAPVFGDCQVRDGSAKKRRLSSRMLREKLKFRKAEIPQWIWMADEQTVWAYVRGLLLTDGSATMSASSGSPISIAFASIHHEWLKNLQLLFRNLGLSASIYKLRDGGQTELPNGKGSTALYATKDCYRLVVGNKTDALEIERNTGFLSRKGVSIEDRKYRDNSRNVSEVVSVEYVGRETVYCPTVKTDEHVFIAQGMLTSNCTEIMLPSTPDESFVCDLSSVNLLYYDEWKNTDFVQEMVYLLDAVMTEYIQKTAGIRLLADAHRFAVRWRAVGLGTLGYHSLLQSKGIPFESVEARALNVEVHAFIQGEADQASKWLAQQYGEPEGMKGTGYRNLTRMAIAPTTSSSIICGQVSQSVEPWDANIFENDNAKGVFTQRNVQLEAVLEAKGKNTTDTWASILQAGGSVQHLDCLTDIEKATFKTFAEIDQSEVIRQAADRQQFIDQGQSINIKLPTEATMKEDIDLIVLAWRLNLKSLYYRRGFNKAQELARQNMSECLSCEA